MTFICYDVSQFILTGMSWSAMTGSHFGSMAQSPGVMIVSQESLLLLELDIPFIEVKPWR